MDQKQYITRVCNAHLHDYKVYKQLNSEETQQHTEKLKEKLLLFFDKHFPPHHNDKTVLTRTFNRVLNPLSYFYILAKIHKKPLTTWPIVSISGSLPEGIGT